MTPIEIRKFRISLIAAIVAMIVMHHGVFPQDRSHGTLVVAVPVEQGLTVCADKRLSNDQNRSFTEDAVKIRKVDDRTLFVATNTVGFRDRTTGKLAFDAFEATEEFLERNPFADTPRFWSKLKLEIRKQILDYLSARKFAEWPETDFENDRLLFNLIFFSLTDNGGRKSHTIRVFYEKAKTPVIFVQDPAVEEVRTPQLSGKGRAVINFIARNPSVAQDPYILRFDQSRFAIEKVNIQDAVNFAGRLFILANTNLPWANVGRTFDCALLSRENGFQWINKSVRVNK